MENERRHHKRPGRWKLFLIMLSDRKLQRKEKQERKAKRKAYQRRYRKEQKKNILKKAKGIFQKKRETDLEIFIIRRKIRADRRQMFIKKTKAFLRSPYRFFFPKPQLDIEEQMIRRKIKQDKRNNAVKWIRSFTKNPYRTLFPREKPDVELKAIRTMVRRDKRENIAKRFSENISTLKQIFNTPDLRIRFSLSFLQSTGFYLLSFMLIYLLYQVATIVATWSYNIPCVWYYYRIKWPMYTFSPLYTRAAMVSIFSAGPIIVFFATIIFFRMFFSNNSRLAEMRLFLLWCMVNGMNMFFGSYIVGFLTRTEFIYSTEWLFMSKIYDVEEILFVLIALVALLIAGRFTTRLFLLTSGSATLIKKQYRPFFILSQVFFPWLVGTGIFYLLTFPEHYLPLTLKTITPVLMIIPMLASAHSERYDEILNAGRLKRTYIRKGVLIFVVVLLFLYRLILNSGLHFSA